MPPKAQNYWLTTVDMPVVDSVPLPESVDIAIIGAGFTGLSAARTLAKRGATVAVLESESIGWGASSRNGGMVLTGMKRGVSQLISKYGHERTRQMYAASLATIDCNAISSPVGQRLAFQRGWPSTLLQQCAGRGFRRRDPFP